MSSEHRLKYTFTQPDGRVPTRPVVPQPGDPQSLNRYTYAGNNPLRYTDPSGHCEDTPDEDDIDCWQFARKFAQEYGEKGLTYEELSQYTYDQLVRFYDELEKEGAKNMRPPSAHGLGVSIDGDVEIPFGFFSAKGTGGVEIIFNHVSKEVDLFLVGGIKTQFSLQKGSKTVMRLLDDTDMLEDIGTLRVVKPKSFVNAGGTFYLAEYDNLPSNDLASGLTNMTSTSAHYGLYGVNYSKAYSTYNPDGPSSVAVGWSPGIGFDLSVDEAAIRYYKVTK